MDVKIVRSNPAAKIPTYGTPGAGAFDIYSISPTFELEQGEVHVCETGLTFEIPSGYGLFIIPRSGLAFSNSVNLTNCIGLLDSDFRGELKVKLNRNLVSNSSQEPGTLDPVTINTGDRIAQGYIIPLPKINFVEVHATSGLTPTERGTGGLGSTGA